MRNKKNGKNWFRPASGRVNYAEVVLRIISELLKEGMESSLADLLKKDLREKISKQNFPIILYAIKEELEKSAEKRRTGSVILFYEKTLASSEAKNIRKKYYQRDGEETKKILRKKKVIS